MLNINSTNRRIKNLLDTEILFLRKKIEDTKTFSIEDIKEIDERYSETCKSLNKIDSNMTENSLRVSGEVFLRQMIDEENLEINLDNISSNQIRRAIDGWTEYLVNSKKEGDDYYSEIFLIIQVSSILCSIYLKQVSTTNSNVDFKEVEKDYE